MSGIDDRKNEHIDVCLDDEVETGAPGGLDGWRLAYRALPEVALDEVDLTTQLAGKTLSAPIVIGAMTGGTRRAGALNRVLAEAAERTRVGFALGSGRIVLERPETADSFRVRDVAPEALVFANLGAVQFNYGVGIEDAARLVATLEADALNLHVNPLQEAVQEGGDTDFRGLVATIGEAARELDAPVFVKEVGSGLDAHTAMALAATPIAGLETAGVGGTSWARVEAYRAKGEASRRAGFDLGAIGVPTGESVRACREALRDGRPVIASGGIRTPEQMAIAMGLGADACAAALPFLKAAEGGGVDGVVALVEHFVHQLRILCFVAGARTPKELHRRVVPRR